MSMFDPISEQIIHQFATDRMWSDETDGDVESPSGYFGRMAVETLDQARELIAEWENLTHTVVVDCKPQELMGYWLAGGDDCGFHWVGRFDHPVALAPHFVTLKIQYGEWLDANSDDDIYEALEV